MSKRSNASAKKGDAPVEATDPLAAIMDDMQNEPEVVAELADGDATILQPTFSMVQMQPSSNQMIGMGAPNLSIMSGFKPGVYMG